MEKPDYRRAYQDLSKVVHKEAALNLCLVHAGVRPGYSDGPEDYANTTTWKRRTEKALLVAAEHGLEFKVAWYKSRMMDFNLFYVDGDYDLNKMMHYELGHALGFPKECLAQLGTLKVETYGFHISCGRVDVLAFVSWHLTDKLVRWAARTAREIKTFVRKERLPFSGTSFWVRQMVKRRGGNKVIQRVKTIKRVKV